MTIGIWVLGDQLWQQQSVLASCLEDKQQISVILIESSQYAQQRTYHGQKLVLVWSAMRHFAEELRAEDWQVTYRITKDFVTPLQDWIQEQNITQLRIMTPSDRPFEEFIKNLDLDCHVELLPNNHFLWSKTEFQAWAKPRKRLLLEDFYRQGRKKFNILMDGDKPIGGKWNFDKQNRKPPKNSLEVPAALWFEPDKITSSVIKRVQELKINFYGKLEPFRWGVSKQQAQQVLEHFLDKCFANFGSYQDAMLTGEDTMWHSLISPYLNLGLLQPMDVIKAAEKAYQAQNLTLNNVEGFIRQILGWREYMYGIYHLMNTDYSQGNWFAHNHPLPEFYWDGTKTEMNCLRQILTQLEATGYAHHIQRLMVLSNFALISGVSPQEIEAWFHATFIDAYDWVMQTNVIGMGQFADGGKLASKPYASSANYINKMSDYCGNCTFDRTSRSNQNSCPFNFFYWDFIDRHQEKLKSLGRMNLVLGNLKRISTEELAVIIAKAQDWWTDHP